MAAPVRPRVIPLRSKAPRPGDGVRLAAIDIGSNSIRQIIADVSTDGRIRVLDEMKAAPRLGTGLDASGRLDEDAMRHALEALHRMATLATQYGATKVESVATSAVRDAANGKQFIELVRRQTGLRVRVLHGDDEARLAFRSALAHFDLARGRAVVMDIGGGSLELAMSADGLLDGLVSLPFGAIRMTEQFLGLTPSRKAVRKLREYVRDDIRRALPLRDWRGAKLICSGGTFTNLAGIYLYRQGTSSAAGRVQGTRVPREELEHIIDLVQECSPEERTQVRGLNVGRSDIILAGLVVAAEVMARTESRDLVVSAYGIREGLLLESAQVTTVPADPGEARERSVNTLAERCHYEAPHAQHVRRLALQLFDAIGPRIGCSNEDRQVLADAALLHDIGYHINYDQHHKHSYHLILHADLLGMSPVEQVLVANVARYHRGSPPKKKHPNFGRLDRESRDRIVRLSSLLRIADGFDRGHVGGVQRVKVRWTDRALRITAVPDPRARVLRLELWGASRKATLLSELAGIPVEIVAPDGTVIDSGQDDGDGDGE
ncbi:MAG TPA: Ppx/GppA phosphatase family protein [Gemmatimonadaceae bacterium]|nr:Ppx/GppA phosphatase family protein [Gemmatimonadaceae bacterium]